jgi:acyl-CoA thioester hydrolase
MAFGTRLEKTLVTLRSRESVGAIKTMEQLDHLLAGFPVVIELPVVWGDMDACRHVNNVAYFRYLESARVEYIARLGWFELEKQTGVGPILASVQARFRKALTYPDRIRVGTRVSYVAEDRFTLEHLIVSLQHQAVVTEGQGTLVSFHYPSGKKVPLPEELRRRIEQLEGQARKAEPEA